MRATRRTEGRGDAAGLGETAACEAWLAAELGDGEVDA